MIALGLDLTTYLRKPVVTRVTGVTGRVRIVSIVSIVNGVTMLTMLTTLTLLGELLVEVDDARFDPKRYSVPESDRR